MTAQTDRTTLKAAIAAQYTTNGTNDIQGVTARTASDLLADFIPAQTLIVSSEGGDYTTIAAALAAITDSSIAKPYQVIVKPGVYIITAPIVMKEYVTLRGEGVVIINQTTTTSNFINMSANSFVRNVALQGATTAGAKGIYMTETGPMVATDITVIDCNIGVLIDDADAVATIRNLQLITVASTISKGVQVTAGNVDVQNVRVGSTSDITRIFDISGATSIVTVDNLKSFSANVVGGIICTDSSQTNCSAIRIISAASAIEVDTGAELRIDDAALFFNATGITLDGADSLLDLNSCRITASTSINIVATAGTLIGTGITTETAEISIAPAVNFHATVLDLNEADEATAIFGECHVGSVEDPTETVMGQGDSYTKGMLVYTYDGSFVNISTAAASPTGSTVTLPDTAVDTAFYFGSTRLNISGIAQWYGLKYLVTTAAVVGTGEMILEYWNGSAWVEFNGMVTSSNANYYQYSKRYLEKIGSFQLRFDIGIPENWIKNDPMTLGTDYYWVRLRIKTAITTAPILEQFKLHSSRREINSDGFPEYFGPGRPQGTLPLNLGLGTELSGNILDRNIWIDENLGAGVATNRFTATTQYFGFFVVIPDDLDTSSPIKLIMAGRSGSAQTIEFQVSYGWVTQGDLAEASNPSSGSNLTTKTVSFTPRAVVADIAEFFEAELDISDSATIKDPTDGSFPDILAITINPVTIPGEFAPFYLEGKYRKWCDGGHV